MMIWKLLTALAAGGLFGYAGVRLAPRWMSAAPRPELAYGAVAVNALLTGLAAHGHGLGGYFWTQALFISLLTLASLVDLHDRIIPNEVVLFGLVGGSLVLLLAPPPGWTWLAGLGGAAFGFGLLLLLALLVKGGMGLGDVKLAAVIGLFLGYPWVFMALVLSFLLGGTVAMVLLALRVVGRKQMIPFGPFLALGAAATSLFGNAIWSWYTSF